MARMMTALGVSEEALILEDQSQDTMENCRNATNLIGRKNRVLVVTSDYHLSRAVMTARRVGFDADGLAAKLPDGDAKRRLMEACYIFDLLMGWQDEGKRTARMDISVICAGVWRKLTLTAAGDVV